MSEKSLIDEILNIPSAARIALWLWLREPNWFTTEEIAQGLPLLTKSRVQQVVQEMYSKNLIERRIRETHNRGPDPYEYRLPSIISKLLEKKGEK
jgi:predicted transcriptional regulator